VTTTSMLNTTFPTAPFTSDNCINDPFCNYQLVLRHSGLCCQVDGIPSRIVYFQSIFRFVCQVPAYNGSVQMLLLSSELHIVSVKPSAASPGIYRMSVVFLELLICANLMKL